MVTKESMTTKEDKQLRNYELVVIISPEVADDGVDAIIDNMSRLISQSGGTVDDVERWGKRRLAYPIKRSMEGNYVLIRCRFKPSLGKELEANLRISEEVLRHLLVRLDS